MCGRLCVIACVLAVLTSFLHHHINRICFLPLSLSLPPQANTAEAVSQLVEHVRHLLGAVCVRDRSVASGGQGQESPAANPAQPQQLPAGTCSQDLSRLTHIALTLILPAAQCQLHVQGLVDSVLQALQDFPQVTCRLRPNLQLCAIVV